MNSHPTVTKFVDKSFRLLMRAFAEVYYQAKREIQEYDATRVSTLLSDDLEDLVADSSQQSGRPPLSCPGVKLSMENIRAIVKQLETPNPDTGISMIAGVNSIAPGYAE